MAPFAAMPFSDPVTKPDHGCRFLVNRITRDINALHDLCDTTECTREIRRVFGGFTPSALCYDAFVEAY